jgi:hypothetical protein
MEFWKFECDTEADAHICMTTGSLPSAWSRPGVEDTTAAVLGDLVPGDGALLATFDGRDAQVFAVGLIRRSPSRDGRLEVSWMTTSGMEVTPNPQAKQYWNKRSAHRISAQPAERYGLHHLVRHCGSQKLSFDERSAFIRAMRDEGYTGERLGQVPLSCDLLVQLQREGFDVYPRGVSKAETNVGPKGTVRVESNGKYIAYVPDGLQQPQHHLVGLAVLTGDSRGTLQAVPEGFNELALQAFAIERGVDPSHLELAPKSGAGDRYIRVSDYQTALTLIHQNAASLDPYYSPPEELGRDASQERDEQVIRARLGTSAPAQCRRLIAARRGQGRYRTALLEKFGGQCAVSGLRLGAALRASHVLAWSRCETDEERLDPNNGLLLSPDLDALFDRYLITFDQAGQIRWSPRLEAHQAHVWPLSNLRVALTPAQFEYMKRHNDEFDLRVRRRQEL